MYRYSDKKIDSTCLPVNSFTGLLIKNATIAFLFFCVFSLPSVAQHTELKQLITLELRQEPISKAFASITQQTGIRFSYNSQLINVNKKISIREENMPLDKALALILPPSVSYKQVGKYIILSVPEQGKKSSSKKNIDSIYLKNNADTFFIQKKYFLSSGITIDSCHRIITPINVEEMNKKLALFALSIAITGSQVSAQTEQTANPEALKKETKTETVIKEKRPFQLTFVYPLGTDGKNSSDNEYTTSFNIIGGRTGKITGFEFANVFNINKYSSTGAQIAGIMNLTGTANNDESSRNVQIAGISNYTRNGTSTQISGIKNIADKTYVQVGGVINLSKKSNTQVTGIVNLTDTSTVQIAGIINANKTNNKVQIAGVVNMTDTANTQISGIANVAKTSSCQISTVNITRKGCLQLGFVNIRDTADGISIGMINIVKKGGLMEWEVGGSEIIHAAASFRSGTQKLYGIISAGYNFSDEFYAMGFGIGSEITLKNKWRLNLEGIHYNLYDKEFERDNYGGLVQIRPIINYKFTEHFKIYAGPTLNLAVIEKKFGFEAPYTIWDTTEKDQEISAWIGFTVGMRF